MASDIATKYDITLLSDPESRCNIGSLLVIDFLDPAGVKLSTQKINAAKTCLLHGFDGHATADCRLIHHTKKAGGALPAELR